LRRFFWKLVAQEVADLIAQRIDRLDVDFRDPLQLFEANRTWVLNQLKQAANYVGTDVIVGKRVIMWGGVHPNGVGLRLNDSVRIYDECKLVIDHMSANSGISIGRGSALNFGCYIDGSGGVAIGQRTVLGPYVVIISSSHRVEPNISIQSSDKHFGGVTIGNDVWIGANAVIRAGVTIGDGSVVGAGAIVTHDVPPHTITAGNPAKAIRRIRAP
jgi:acetyltransferase-like isoleucine patch superfamily enzyme